MAERLNVLTIPRRGHAGKTSMENLDSAWAAEQAKMHNKIKHRSEVLANYEKTLGPTYSPINGTPIGTPRTRVGIHVDARSDIGSTVVEVGEEAETPVAERHKRRNSGSINLFAPLPSLKHDAAYRVKPPFATDDETPKKYSMQRKPAPFAAEEEEQPSTKPASAQPPVNFCWRWAFQDEGGNALPEDPSPRNDVQTIDFSSMSPRHSYLHQSVPEGDEEVDAVQ